MGIVCGEEEEDCEKEGKRRRRRRRRGVKFMGGYSWWASAKLLTWKWGTKRRPPLDVFLKRSLKFFLIFIFEWQRIEEFYVRFTERLESSRPLSVCPLSLLSHSNLMLYISFLLLSYRRHFQYYHRNFRIILLIFVFRPKASLICHDYFLFASSAAVPRTFLFSIPSHRRLSWKKKTLIPFRNFFFRIWCFFFIYFLFLKK